MDSNINETPLISVLMPVFNCELYIKEAIESILNQTYSNFEFLIIDDASSDQTLSIIKTYDDHRIKLIEKPVNTGLTYSLNIGLSIAKGEYIARMDGDDICLPERFAKQISFLENNMDYVLCGTNYKILGMNIIVQLPQDYDAIKLTLLDNCCVAHPTVMYRKKTIDKFDLVYDILKEPAEDYDMWVRLISKGKFYNIQETLLMYRVHGTQVSQKRFIQQRNISIEAKLDLLNYLVFSPTEREVLRKIINGKVRVYFDDVEMFNSIKNKLLDSNSVHVFEPIGFNLFITSLEEKLLRMFFYKKERYTPSDFIKYLKIKCKFKLKFTFRDEFKLFIKSFILFKK